MKKPFVTTYHGVYNAGNPLKRFCNSVMARGDVVIANSSSLRRMCGKNIPRRQIGSSPSTGASISAVLPDAIHLPWPSSPGQGVAIAG